MRTDTPDVLLVTDTKLESQAVLGVFQDAANQKAKPIEIGHRTYFDLGTHNGARVFLTQSELDSGGEDATTQTVKRGIETLKPAAVIQVAIASPNRKSLDKSSSSLPFFSDLKNAESQSSGVQVHPVTSEVDWILVEGIDDSAGRNPRSIAANAASFILRTLQSVSFARSDAATEASPPESEVPSSLPKQPFFFGREKELAIIADAISPESRTWGVLIDGPGGIGKTSLAVRAGRLAPPSHFSRKIFLSAKIRELTSQGEQPRTDFITPTYLAILSDIARELGNKDLAKLPESERPDSLRRILAGERALIVIDNLETLPDADRQLLYQFLGRLPAGSKAIVTSRRRSDLDARVIRVDRLDLKDALSLIDQLAKSNRALAAATVQEKQMLYEFTGGNPLLLGWTAGQLGRRGSQCRTVADACAFLRNAPQDNDPLEYIFGDLLDTFTTSETAVLAVLTHFILPVAVKGIAELAGLALQQAQVALDDLSDRALIAADPAAQTFYLPPLAAKFLGVKRPEAVAQTGERLADRASTIAVANGYRKYECFPVLEAEWPVLSAAIPWLFRGESARLQSFCGALKIFLDFSGRWDELQRLSLQAEAAALAANDLRSAGWRAYNSGWVSGLRGQGAETLLAADRAIAHWRKVDAGPQEQSAASRLRGIGYWLERNSKAALSAYQEALALIREVDPESDEIPFILNDLANIDLSSNDYAAAEAKYQEALQIAVQTENLEGTALYTANLANLELHRGNWSSAEKLARGALKFAEALGRQELIGSDCSVIAQSLARRGRPAEGLPYALRGADILTRLGQNPKSAYAQAVLKECQPD
jgi:tetratricopeptide (TPR) repeat protein